MFINSHPSPKKAKVVSKHRPFKEKSETVTTFSEDSVIFPDENSYRPTYI